MKINPTLLIMLVTCSLPACQGEDETKYPQFKAGAKLKTVITYPLGSTDNYLYIASYQYDTQGKIEKILHSSSDSLIYTYQQYIYDTEGRLIKIAHYQLLSDAYVNTLNEVYLYNEHNQVEKELHESPKTGSSESVLFAYQGDLLAEKRKYGTDGHLTSTTTFTYDKAGNVTREVSSDPAGNYLTSMENEYDQGLLTKSTIYSGTEKEVVREITRQYDKQRNLIRLKAKVVALWVSSTSHEMHYEYF